MKLPPDEDSDNSSADSAQTQQDVDFSDYMWMGEEMEEFDSKVSIVTGPPTNSVEGQYCFALWRLSSSVVIVCRGSVTLHGGPAGGFTCTNQAMTSCRLQSNHSSTITLHGGPVVLHLVRATPCFITFCD